jgi:hypothetical protein
VIEKSTVPSGTAEILQRILSANKVPSKEEEEEEKKD